VGSFEKKALVRSLNRAEKPVLLGLVENKHSNLTHRDVWNLWGGNNVGWVHCLAIDKSGGLILMSVMRDVDAIIKVFSISKAEIWLCLHCCLVYDNFESLICLIYASTDILQRRKCWDQLRALKNQVSIPLLMVGNFNEVLAAHERKIPASSSTGMHHFELLVQDL